MNWPLYRALEVRRPVEAPSCFRIGKHSSSIYPSVPEAATEEDPYTLAALQVTDAPLSVALGVASAHSVDPPFAWPEEANAARIRGKVRNSLQREPLPFSPSAVHLLRDTAKLYAFLADIANGRVRQSGSEYILVRGADHFRIGRLGDPVESLARQVVCIERSLDGKALPLTEEHWEVSPEDAVAIIGSRPMASLLCNSPDWEMWQDVIRGLVLEHGSRRGAA